MIFLDSNIILRYLTGDDTKKAENCYELFQKAKTGEIRLVTCEAVITEVCIIIGKSLQIARGGNTVAFDPHYIT